MNAIWTDEDMAMLKRLWKEGRSATQIAKQIGGRTRNAVLGKLHRLAVVDANGGHPVKPVRDIVEKPARTPAEPKVAKVTALPASRPPVAAVSIVIEHRTTAPKPLLMKLFELESGDCRWPVQGEKAATLFCGHNVRKSEVYCTYHCRIAYAPRVKTFERKAA